MIKNYLKIAWRNLLKNKVHSFINMVGLSVGMAVAMLIGLWIYDELSFDKYHQNYDRIVQVMQNQTFNGTVTTQTTLPIPLGIKLRQDYKGDFKYVVLSTSTDEHVVAFGDKKLARLGNYMQAEATDMLTLKMLKGNCSGLNDPSSILLSSTLAKALFGNADPMDQSIKIDNKWNVKVTGVYENLPNNTSFKDIAFIAPWDLYVSTPFLRFASTRWGINSWQVFAQLAPNADLGKVSAEIKNLKLENILAKGDKVGASVNPAIFLHPMRKWHLYSEFKNGVNTGGRIQFVWMFGIIGIFVLLLACINYMNLSTARSEKRAKEVGIRKTLGSRHRHLIGQFFCESMLLAFFAFFLSLFIVQLILPWFNQVSDKKMSILLTNPLFWLIGVIFCMFTGLIAGSYPAFYLSSFKPVTVLKGAFKVGRFAVLPRKILVVLQFTVSVTLIICTIVVFRQIEFTKNRPVGYSRNGLIQVQMKTNEIHDHFNAVRNDLLQSGAITDIAESSSPVTDVSSSNSDLVWKDKAPGTQADIGTIWTSPEYGKTVNWKVILARGLSRDFITDSSAMVLNEAAVKLMNLKHPVGETIKFGKNYKVIGVIADMVMSSPYSPVKPTVFMLLNEPGQVTHIRINPAISARQALNKIQAVFKQYDPASPFDYNFADTQYAKKFADEERIGSLAGFFAIFAIFISCLGLFGMASFMARQRVKEIGVRKVLGASVFNLWSLLSKDFVLLVIISLLIATPTAFYFMHKWLQNYAYRSEMAWWIFASAGAGALAIPLLTVSYQSIKAALANPVNSLRSE